MGTTRIRDEAARRLLFARVRPWMLLGFAAAGVWGAPVAEAANYFVATSGSDAASGLTQQAAWKTLQHAADVVAPGDVVTVLEGHHAGFNLFTSGTAQAPIAFRAVGAEQGPNPAVIIDQNNTFTNKDRLNLEGASYVVLEGFTVVGTGDPATNRACIRCVGTAAAPAHFVSVRNTLCDLGGRWGIFTGFVDDLLIESNETSRAAAEHGIYVSNSGDRPVIRRNHVWGNHSNGIHLNGDASQGGDGVISNAVIERNVIHGNGAGNPAFGPPGGSAINCDGVRDSLIQNNLLYDNHKSGISLYRIDGGAPSRDNVVVNNTVHNAPDARWALNIQDGAINTRIRNNILFNDHPFRGAIDISADSLPGLASDQNLVKDAFGIAGTIVSFAQWQAQTGQDAGSDVGIPAETFADHAAADYTSKPGSLAIDRGGVVLAPFEDLLGKPRPAGAGFDRGCYEFGSCLGWHATFGVGLPGLLDALPTLVLGGCPDLGDTLELGYVPSAPGAPGLLLAGAQGAQIPAFGGVIYVAPTLTIPLPGPITLQSSVPSDPALIGLVIGFQALCDDAAAPQGIAISEALAVRIGG